MRVSLRISLALLVVSVLANSTFAQTLADRIPADAIIYVGWKGTADLGAAYDGSHAKAVVDASALPQLFNQFLPDLIRKVRTKDPRAAEHLDLMSAAGAPLWRHPSAFYFGGIETMGPKSVIARAAILCDAGDEAPQLLARLKTIVDQVSDARMPLMVTSQGTLVILSTFDFPAKPEAPLAASKPFIDALAQVHKEPVASAYVDGDGLLQLIDTAVNAGGDAAAIKNWPTVRAASGLQGVKHIAWSAGFEGADWSSRAFIDAPAPRTGMLALLENKPLPDDLLKSIPKSATLVAAGGLDLSRVLAEVRAVVKSIDPNAAQNLEKGLSAGSMMLGANVEKDLIDPFGPHWAAYCAPSVGGNGILGLTLINRLDEPAKAERSLGMLEVLTNNMIVMQTRKQKDAPRIAFRQTKTNDMTLHFLPVPFVAPSWGVKGQNLYVALFPQVVTGAASQATAKDSILDNETFTKARAGVNGEKASAIQYLDLPAVGSEGYSTVLAITQMGLGFADMFGVPVPPMVLPSLDKLRPHFAPVIAVAWSDDRGFYLQKVSPFPGAEYFGTQSQALIGQNAMMMSILLPSLNRARETANRVKCASNLRQLGLATLLYSNENDGKHAPTLGDLLRTQDITIDVFVCPSAGHEVPRDIRAAAMDAKVAWVNENSSYVWAGAGKTNSMAVEDVLCYERMDNHGGDGINVLFGDGHVEFLLRAGAEKLLADKGLSVEVPAANDPGAAPVPPTPGTKPERPQPPLRPRPRPAP